MQNTVEILNSINLSVKEIVKNMSPRNGSGADATAKLSRGDIANGSDLKSTEKKGIQFDVSNASLGSIVTFLNTLSPSVIAISKITQMQIKRFTRVIDAVVKSMESVTEYVKGNKDSLESFKVLAESMGVFSDSMKKSMKLPLYSPLASLGFTLARVAIKAYLNILNDVKKAGDISTTIKRLNAMTKSVKDIIGFVKEGALLITVCMGLGLLISLGPTRKILLYGLAVLGGVLLTMVAIIGVVAIASKLLKDTKAISGMREIMLLAFASMGLIIASYALGLFITKAGGLEYILFGLGAVFAVLVAFSLIFMLIGWMSKTLITIDTIYGFAAIMILAFASIGLVVVSKYLGDFVKENYDGILWGLGAVAVVLVALAGIGFLAGKLLDGSKKGVIALAAMEILALGAIGLMYLLANFVTLQRDENITWGEFYLALAGASSVIVAFGGLAVAAGALIGLIGPGIAAMAGVEILAAGAIGLITRLLEFAILKKKENIDWGEFYLDLAGAASVITAFGGIATAFGFISPFVIAGSVALLPTIEMAKGSIDLSNQILILHKTMKESSITWAAIKEDVDGLEDLIRSFGKLAKSFGWSAGFVTMGTYGLKSVCGLIDDVVDVTYKLIDVGVAIEKAGGSEKVKRTLSVDIPTIMSNINSKNFDINSSILKTGYISAKYKAVRELMLGVMTVVEAISRISQVCGVIDNTGKIKPVLSVDGRTGKVTYGDPVDIKNIAVTITDTVKIFIEELKFGLDEALGVFVAADIMKVFATIIDPVTKFVEMLMKYDTGSENTTKLCTITLDEKGNPKKGTEIDVASVAKVISGAVSSFVTELYKTENTQKWAQIIYGDANFFQDLFGRKGNRGKSVSEVAGIFGLIVEPVCSFVDLISALEPTDEKSLAKIYYDSDGNPRRGRPVDVIQTAKTISKLISYFVGSVYAWNIANEDKDSNSLESLLKPIETVVKIASDISDEKLSDVKIIKNSNAISAALISMTTPLSTIDSSVLAGYIVPLEGLVTFGMELSDNLDSNKIITNSKSIANFMTDVVEKKFPKSVKNIDGFTASVKNLKTAFVELDDVLITDEEKRNKALEKFGESVGNILTMVDDSKDSIATFKDLVESIQNFDIDKIRNLSSVNSSTYSQIPQQNTSETQQVVVSSSLTQDDIEAAIRAAFTGVSLSKQVTMDFDSDKNIDDIQETTFTFEGL